MFWKEELILQDSNSQNLTVNYIKGTKSRTEDQSHH